MSEVNQNPNSFNAQVDSETVKTIEITVHDVVGDETVSHSNSESGSEKAETANKTETSRSRQKIDWHKMAHKLREQNRKLLKRVFQLEQEKAELEDSLHQQLEKTYTSNSAIAQQAEQIARLSEQLEFSRQEAKRDREDLEYLTESLESSQRQAARLERECALLQESHNEKIFQLSNKDKQIKELSVRLSESQHNALQHQGALNRYSSETTIERKSSKAAMTPIKKTKSQPIQVWSLAVAQDKIPLPVASSGTSQREQAKDKTSKCFAPAIAKPKQTKKIESLAAVELPRFSR